MAAAGCSPGSAPRASVIVACGGAGLRYRESLPADTTEHAGVKQGDTDKQFLLLAGKPVLAYTLDVLENHPLVEMVVLVLPQDMLDRGKAMVDGLWPTESSRRYQKVAHIVAGGEDRQSSVANGLKALAGIGWEGLVLIQDGVRPNTSPQVYDRVIQGVLEKGNAVAAIRLRDTLKRTDGDGLVLGTVDRHGMWQIQTPQGFRMHEIHAAYEEGRKRRLQATDDASLVEAMGRPVHLVEGDPANIKLTYPSDKALLEALIMHRSMGIDIGMW
ncbi:MAG: 2-C-methyl-D-erythritol 4-phosphate cytidylyltransferase [Clostridiales bacterium]|nr:2-C-methyl-D-erythritol 4-phosphate cytidylyltransferase [Clostridiales bacterium]